MDISAVTEISKREDNEDAIKELFANKANLSGAAFTGPVTVNGLSVATTLDDNTANNNVLFLDTDGNIPSDKLDHKANLSGATFTGDLAIPGHTNVGTAITNLQDDKANLSGATFTGDLAIPGHTNVGTAITTLQSEVENPHVQVLGGSLGTTGATVTASNTGYTSTPAGNIFDNVVGNRDTGWHNDWHNTSLAFPAIIKIAFTSPTRVSKLRFLPRSSFPTQLPNQFQIYGTNDNMGTSFDTTPSTVIELYSVTSTNYSVVTFSYQTGTAQDNIEHYSKMDAVIPANNRGFYTTYLLKIDNSNWTSPDTGYQSTSISELFVYEIGESAILTSLQSTTATHTTDITTLQNEVEEREVQVLGGTMSAAGAGVSVTTNTNASYGPPSQLFDNVVGGHTTGYHNNSEFTPAIIKLTFPSATKLSKLRMLPRNGVYSNQLPKKFQLYGTNDNMSANDYDTTPNTVVELFSANNLSQVANITSYEGTAQENIDHANNREIVISEGNRAPYNIYLLKMEESHNESYNIAISELFVFKIQSSIRSILDGANTTAKALILDGNGEIPTSKLEHKASLSGATFTGTLAIPGYTNVGNVLTTLQNDVSSLQSSNQTSLSDTVSSNEFFTQLLLQVNASVLTQYYRSVETQVLGGSIGKPSSITLSASSVHTNTDLSIAKLYDNVVGQSGYTTSATATISPTNPVKIRISFSTATRLTRIMLFRATDLAFPTAFTLTASNVGSVGDDVYAVDVNDPVILSKDNLTVGTTNYGSTVAQGNTTTDNIYDFDILPTVSTYTKYVLAITAVSGGTLGIGEMMLFTL